MAATVWCKKCGESSHYLDDVDFGFDCKFCGYNNPDGDFKRIFDK